jgi:hypothetical protein
MVGACPAGPPLPETDDAVRHEKHRRKEHSRPAPRFAGPTPKSGEKEGRFRSLFDRRV